MYHRRENLVICYIRKFVRNKSLQLVHVAHVAMWPMWQIVSSSLFLFLSMRSINMRTIILSSIYTLNDYWPEKLIGVSIPLDIRSVVNFGTNELEFIELPMLPKPAPLLLLIDVCWLGGTNRRLVGGAALLSTGPSFLIWLLSCESSETIIGDKFERDCNAVSIIW